MVAFVVLAGVLIAQVLIAPVLGGAPASFEQLLGAANDASVGPQLHYLRCAGTDVDQFVLMAPSDVIWTIDRYYCDAGSRTPEERIQEATQFLPPDATPGDAITSEAGEAGQTYVSPTIGSALPAQLFHDCAGQPVALG